MSKAETADEARREVDYSLKGTTLKVYRYMFKSGGPVRASDIQRDLGLSSLSVAQYHVKKLLESGLIREEQDGYEIDKVVFESIVRFKHLAIPYQLGYIAFFVASLVAMLTVLRPTSITSVYFFSLLVVIIAVAISVREMHSTLKRIG